ncbi:MAG: D-glycerate dehydrogenase [Deltaproteobacteria bacterium]|nr:D-glycerate dehydrogenase [Deltaproteobacteria bacterium]
MSAVVTSAALCSDAVHVVSTSALPIDLENQIVSALPGTTVEIPATGHVGLAGVDLRAADALVCLLLDRVDDRVLAGAPKLRIVANCAVGVDNIDLGAAARRTIAVSNTPDVLTEATAELAFTLMLVAARRIGEGERLIRSGAWTGWALDQLLGVELHGKTMGILGFGRIGQAMARRAVGFGMQVIYANPRPVRESSAKHVELDELFSTADVISLHCPLTPETRKVVDARRLGLMKRTAILVNTARGDCVDEPALIAALTSGALFGAGLDVYVGEPGIHRDLLTCPRLVLAPHIGSATTETRTAMAQLCADAVIAVLSGRRPTNLVTRKP